MKTAKRATIVLLLLVAATCMVFAAGTKEKGAKSTYKIALSTFSQAIPWQIQTVGIAKDAAKAMGSKVDFTVVNCNLKVADQITQLQNLMNQGYDAILVDASSATGLNPTLAQAKAAGIVLVSYNCTVSDPNVVTSRVFVDQKQWGADMAQWLVDKLGNKGNVVCLTGLSGNQIAADRVAGMTEVFAKYPNINILCESACGMGARHCRNNNAGLDHGVSQDRWHMGRWWPNGNRECLACC